MRIYISLFFRPGRACMNMRRVVFRERFVVLGLIPLQARSSAGCRSSGQFVRGRAMLVELDPGVLRSRCDGPARRVSLPTFRLRKDPVACGLPARGSPPQSCSGGRCTFGSERRHGNAAGGFVSDSRREHQNKPALAVVPVSFSGGEYGGHFGPRLPC